VLPHDHLLLRYSTDCNALLHAPFDHPDVLCLRRVADETLTDPAKRVDLNQPVERRSYSAAEK